MEVNQVLEKLSDKKRQPCDNFATTKKNQKTNKIIRIYIYILRKLSLLFS